MKAAGIEVTNVGTGSTPCCSHSGAAAMKQLTEIHPGNYVLYDTQQMAVGRVRGQKIVARLSESAVSLLANSSFSKL